MELLNHLVQLKIHFFTFLRELIEKMFSLFSSDPSEIMQKTIFFVFVFELRMNGGCRLSFRSQSSLNDYRIKALFPFLFNSLTQLLNGDTSFLK